MFPGCDRCINEGKFKIIEREPKVKQPKCFNQKYDKVLDQYYCSSYRNIDLKKYNDLGVSYGNNALLSE